MAGRSIEDMSIAFIGAGNLATNLAKALYRKGFRIVQVYSRTKESAQELAQTVEAAYTTELQAVTKEAQLYIVSLKDRGFCRIITPDCFWKGECFMGAYSRQYSYEYLAGACCALWSALSDADFQ